MTGDIFRVVVAVGVILAALAFVIQAGVVIAVLLESKKTQRLITKFLGDVKPLLAKAGTFFNVANQIVDDARPQIKEITADVVDLAKSSRERVEQLGGFLHEASERARACLEQIDNTVESAVEQIEQAGDSVKRAVMKPVKEVNGLAAGISAALSTLVNGARQSGTRHLT